MVIFYKLLHILVTVMSTICCQNTICAYENKHITCFSNLINMGIEGKDAHWLLCDAASTNNEEIMNIILQRVIFPEEIIRTSKILLQACENSNLNCVRLLLNAGFDVNQRGYNDYTPLIIASMVQNELIVRELILRGADINLADKQGKTAIVHASQQGNDEIVESLIQAGSSRKKLLVRKRCSDSEDRNYLWNNK